MPCRRITKEEFENLPAGTKSFTSPDECCNSDQDCGTIWGDWTFNNDTTPICVRNGCNSTCQTCACGCPGGPDLFDFNPDLLLCLPWYEAQGFGLFATLETEEHFPTSLHFSNEIPNTHRKTTDPDVEPYALITRNKYGAIILNSKKVLFLDFDIQQNQTKHEAYEEIKKILLKTGLTFKTYKTPAGFRAACINKEFTADSPEAIKIMADTGTDQKYMGFCLSQKCFRARLTPKPWRLGCKKPPNKYPRNTPEEQTLFQEWTLEYESKSKNYATCKFIETLGNPHDVDEKLSIVVEQHDIATKAMSNLTLEPKEYTLTYSIKNQNKNHFKSEDYTKLTWKKGYPAKSPYFFLWIDNQNARYFRINRINKNLTDITYWAIEKESQKPTTDPILECQEMFLTDTAKGPEEKLAEIPGEIFEITTKPN